jgi:chemotaxis protein MotB
MKPRLACLGGAAVAAAFALGGCVTQGTYEKLEAEKAQEVGTLQSQREALERERNALRAEKGLLEKEKGLLEEDKALLEADKSALERDRERLRAENEALEREKSKLLEASRQTQTQYDALVADLSQELQKGELQVRRYQDMLTVEVAEQLFFDSGRSTLKDTGKAVLKKVADALKSYEDKAIRVVGHTDNVPIAKSLQKRFPSNWELSSARATTVVRFLQEAGIEPERLVATGRAEYAPVAANDSEDGRQKNRRIEITLVERGLLRERPAEGR